jgi:N-acetylmuramoyl-L-alanine amidase
MKSEKILLVFFVFLLTLLPFKIALPQNDVEKFDTIVLDPGHGGKDTGAKGKFLKIYEKDVVLSVAKLLKEKIETRMGITVILTRSDDYFVPIKDRTAIANNHKADLLISIHTNAAFREGANGFEAFILSNKSSDKAAQTVAVSENKAIELEDTPEYFKDELNSLLWSLAQNQFLDESCQLCDIIQKEYSNSLNITNRGIKQAPFYVLYGAIMPAVLVEIGFVTNKTEEEKLSTTGYQDKISEILYKSILIYRDDYFNKKMLKR